MKEQIGWDIEVPWDDYTKSTPLHDMANARKALILATGQRPNLVRIGSLVAEDLTDHPSIKDLTKYTREDALTGGLPTMIRQMRVEVVDAEPGVVVIGYEDEALPSIVLRNLVGVEVIYRLAERLGQN